MRILLMPAITIRNIASDSEFLTYRSFMRINPDAFYYWAVQEDLAGEVRELLGEEFRNVEVLGIPGETTQEVYPYLCTGLNIPWLREMFQIHKGRYPIDAVLVARAQSAGLIGPALENFWLSGDLFPVFLHEPYVYRVAPSVPIEEQVLHTAAYLNTYPFFLSSEEERRALAMVKGIASPSMLRDVKKRSQTVGRGIDTQSLKPYLDSPKHDKFSVFFGARLNAEKKADTIMDFAEKFFAFGRGEEIQVVLCTSLDGAPAVKDFQKRMSFLYRFRDRCPRDEYLTEAAQCHMFLCASIFEGDPQGFREQLYLLQVGIFPDKKWSRAWLPEDWPFFYKNEMEGHALIRWIHNHYEEALEKVAFIRPWIEQNKDQRVIFRGEFNRMHAIAQRYRKSIGFVTTKQTRMNTLILECSERMKEKYPGKPIGFDTFLEDIIAHSTRGVQNFTLSVGGLRTPSKKRVYHVLSDDGWEDTLDSAMPQFILKES